MAVRKGPGLTNRSNKNTYYIELSNTYFLLAEVSSNTIQTNHNTNTEINFKVKAAARCQKNITSHINKYIIKDKDNDAAIINTSIQLADYEHNIRNKTAI